jgi:single-stranded-DNA-specific exonuclease
MSNKIWKIYDSIDQEQLKTENVGRSSTILQILYNRGITLKEDIDFFLEADYDKNGFDPLLFSDLSDSLELLIGHIKNKHKITVYGDYDADGVTSSVLLVDVLRLLRADVDYYIPDRVSEGYGLNIDALDQIVKDGSKLVITVDNGIRNKQEVEFLKSKGVDIIITDHHQGPENIDDYPACLIINPALSREKLPFNRLAGVGVALKLIEALINKSKLEDELKARLKDSFFDLAAIGTIADCVSLQGENRLIVKKGLKKLSQTKRLGLIELIKVSSIKNPDNIDSWNVGFQIAPRINAAGRMDHANTAFSLLLSKDSDEAKRLAEELNFNNQMRQKSTEHIFESVENQIKNDTKKYLLSAVYEYQEGEEHKPWNEGIIGLVSGKVTEKYYRPSIIITSTEDGYKGSGRSIPEFNIAEALEKSKEFLKKYGGHPLACGFSLKKENLEDFISKMNSLAEEKLGGLDLRPKILIDQVLNFSEINESFVDSLDVLKPHGQDNPQPIFLSKNIQVLDKIGLGANGQHLKLKLKNGTSSIVSAIGFSQSEKWSFVEIGDLINIVYNIDINDFNGKREPQLKIIDIQIYE